MDAYLFRQSVHKDFHYTLSLIFDFMKENYGEEEMVRMMKNVAQNVYTTLIKNFKEDGLSEVEKHMGQLMQLENGEYEVEKGDDLVTFLKSRISYS